MYNVHIDNLELKLTEYLRMLKDRQSLITIHMLFNDFFKINMSIYNNLFALFNFIYKYTTKILVEGIFQHLIRMQVLLHFTTMGLWDSS